MARDEKLRGWVGAGSGGWCRHRSREGRDQGQLLCDFEAGLANELSDGSGGEAGCVVLDTEGVCGTIKAQAADAVYVFCACQGEDGGFRGLRGVAKENLHLGHRRMIARGGILESGTGGNRMNDILMAISLFAPPRRG